MTKPDTSAVRFDAWAGNPRGTAYVPTRCAAEVLQGWHLYQCSRPNGHGRHGLFCRQHQKFVLVRLGRPAETLVALYETHTPHREEGAPCPS